MKTKNGNTGTVSSPSLGWEITKSILLFIGQVILTVMMWAARILGTILLKLSDLLEKILDHE